MSEHLPQTNYLDPEVLQKLGDLELVAREVVEGLRVGSHRSHLRGFSTEFAHHRQYAPGDAIRDIDWRVFGRTDRYYTKLYEAETNYDCHILIDASSSMNYASRKVSKLEYAKFLAASLAYIVLKQRDSVGLSIFDSEVRAYLPPSSSIAAPPATSATSSCIITTWLKAGAASTRRCAKGRSASCPSAASGNPKRSRTPRCSCCRTKLPS